MNATAQLQGLGQSLWLDNITREMLDSGQLQRYIDEFSISGLTSNPSIFDKAIKSGAYDDEIRRKAAAAADRERLFFELAIERPPPSRGPVRRRYISGRPGSTAGCRWRSHRCSPTTPPAACAPRPTCMHAPDERTCSSRSLGPSRGWRRSKRRPSPGCRSTSRCCSRASSTWPAPMRTCAGSSAGSRPAWIRMCPRSRRCSSPAGTRR